MADQNSQDFLRELDKKLWTAADSRSAAETAGGNLRSNLDAAVYKHAVLGLIFLKYVSDSFAQRQGEIEAMLKDPGSDYFMDPADYKEAAAYEKAIRAELEERDYYIEKNVFWVPALARWKTLQDCHARMRSCKMRSHPAERPRSGGYSAKLPAGTEITVKNGKTAKYKITSTGKLIDDAVEAVEKENSRNGDLPVSVFKERRQLSQIVFLT